MQLSARIFLIVLSLMIMVTGCEKRVLKESTLVDFDMLSPVANSNVTTTDDIKMKVKYSGKTNLSNLYLELNGADITSDFAINNVSDLAVADMASLRGALLQGSNTLITARRKMDINNVPVVDPISGEPVLEISRTFTFYFDDEAPRLTVDSVVPNALNPDFTPLAGTSIVVTGKVIDASTVTDVRFTYPGGVVNLLSVSTPVSNNGNNQFNSATGDYTATLLNYPAITAPTTAPHFTYTAKDEFKHTRTEQFMASGTKINKAAALQINGTFASTFTPFLNALVVNGFQKVKQFDVMGTYAPFNRINGNPALIGDLIEDPFNSPVSDKRVWIAPQGQLPCTRAFIGVGTDYDYCVIYLTDVNLVNPSAFLDFSDRKDADLIAKLGMWVGYLGLDVTIGLIKDEGFGDYRYQAKAEGKIEWSNFSMETNLIIKPGDAVNAFNITREPFKWVLRDLLKVPKVTGTCPTCTNAISLALLFEAFGGDILQPANPPPIDPNVNCPSFQQPGNDVPDKKDLIALGECAAEQIVGIKLDNFLAGRIPAVISSEQQGLKQIEKELGVANAYTVYNNNAHMVLNGRNYTAPAFYDGSAQTVNGGLGSIFAPQGSYYTNLIPSVKGWPITLAGKKNLDISFALSANSVNQWLLAKHQSGMFNEYLLTDKLTGADLPLAGSPTDNLSLIITTHEPPSVTFISEDTSSANVCVGNKCTPVNKASPGMIRLSMKNLDVTLKNQTTGGTDKLKANINLELIAELRAINGLPDIKIKSDSLKVSVNASTIPSDVVISKSRTARNIEQGIELIVLSPAFTEMLKQRPTVVESVSDLASVGCPTALPTGQLCLASSPVPLLYKDLLDDDGLVDSNFKSDIGLQVKWLTVEKKGSYLSVGLDSTYKQGGFSPAELQSIFMNYQITQ